MDRAQISSLLRRWSVLATTLARNVWGWAWPALAKAWSLARPVLLSALEFLLALIIVFEEWGWRPLAEALGWLGRWRPWAMVEGWIVRLPPYLALLVFALPSALLIPLKFLALLLIADGHVVLAGGLFVFAKVLATALIARLFMLTEPALMQIGWFAASYATIKPWKEALVARVHASWAWRMGRLLKTRLHHRARAYLPNRTSASAAREWVRTGWGRLTTGGRERFGDAWRWLGLSR
jgi:hypothetical protein